MKSLYSFLELRITCIIALILVTLTPPVAASALEKAQPYLPMLSETVGQHWPQAPLLSYFAAKIEQETCITERHAKCWNPRAELKTSREYGFGFGQITTAYRADGTVRFDKFAELRATHAVLNSWEWSDRFEPSMQMAAMVLMDKTSHRRFQGMYATVYDGLSFSASAYNGGEGGVLQDRRLCANSPGCDPMRWADNVALHSTKSRVKWQGYGQSAYDINRGYVQKVLYERRQKYVAILGT